MGKDTTGEMTQTLEQLKWQSVWPSPVYAYSIAHLSAIVKGFLKTFSKSFREEDCRERITSKLVPLAPLRI